MTLTDAGPLVALIDKGDNGHAACTAVLPRLARPMVTTWPCYTEAMHLLGRSGGFTFQDKLWRLYNDGLLIIHALSAAETLGVKQIFTVDSDFYFYILANGSASGVVPCPFAVGVLPLLLFLVMQRYIVEGAKFSGDMRMVQ